MKAHLRGPDITLYAPTYELADPVRGVRVRKNPTRRKRSFDQEALRLYDGYDGFLVRTAIIRSEKFDSQRAKSPKIGSSRDVAEICAHLKHADQEHLVTLTVDSSFRLTAIHEVAIGGSSSVAADMKHVVKVAVLTVAHGVFLVHNHPSGGINPSKEDVEFTLVVDNALKCVDIKLFDHVIVGRDGYYSFLDSRMLR